MKTEKLPPQQKPKSIFDLTPYELSQIDKFQTQNRGYRDEDDREYESYFNWETDER